VSGTRAWSIVLRDQGALPWAWNALSRLPLSAACVLFVLSAAALHAPEGKRGLAAQCWEQGLCALLAALCAGLFFGGGLVAASAGALTFALGGIVAALKGLVCYALLRALDGSVLLHARKWLWVSLIAVTPLWVRLAPSRSFELIWGSVICVVCGCIALAGLVSLRSTRARTSAAAAPKPTAASVVADSASAAPKKVARRSTAARPARPLPQTQV
jgi:hypothetical protein